jgi:hypothetical protein
MDDEPLEEWAACRDRRRPTCGERRSTPLGDQPEQGSHVNPDAPRGIQEWDGQEWIPVGVAEDFTAATNETNDDAASRVERAPRPSFSKLPPLPEPWRPTERFYRS